MIRKEDIVARVLSKDTTQPQARNAGAFATEIPSNEFVVGNLNSHNLERVTPEKDNGMAKQAQENKYLEKIAEAKNAPSKLRAAGRSIAETVGGTVAGMALSGGTPIMGIAGGVLGGIHGYKASMKKQHKEIRRKYQSDWEYAKDEEYANSKDPNKKDWRREPLEKAAENKYLVKTSTWLKELSNEFKKAGPLTQFTVGSGVVGTGLSIRRTMSSSGMAQRDMERSEREKNSLKALHGINKSLTTNQLDPSAMIVKRPKGF